MHDSQRSGTKDYSVSADGGVHGSPRGAERDDLGGASSREPAPELTEAAKADAVIALLRQAEDSSSLARRCGVPETTLLAWRDRFLAGGRAALINGYVPAADAAAAQRAMALSASESARRRLEADLAFKTEQIATLVDMMTLFVETGDGHDPSAACLRFAIAHTRSEEGIITAVLDDRTVRIVASDWPAYRDTAARAPLGIKGTVDERGFRRVDDLPAPLVEAIVSRRPVITHGGDADGNPAFQNLLAVPVCRGGSLLAVIAVANSPAGYSKADQAILTSMADPLSVIFDSVRRQRHEAQLQAQLLTSERLAAVGTFTAGIAHEINNPVGSILMAGEYALACANETGDLDAIRTALADVVEEAKRTGRVVRGLLQFARHEPTEKHMGSLNVAIRAAIDYTRHELEAADSRVIACLSPELPLVAINVTEIQQVFVNLIRNAAQTAAGPAVIRIRTERCDQTVRAIVTDEGPGMTDEQRVRAFEPFFTTRAKAGGTGLGLSICHGIIHGHGGRIFIESAPECGTTVSVELPVDKAREQRVEEAG